MFKSLWAGSALALMLALLLSEPVEGAESRSCVEYAGEVISAQGTVDFRSGDEWQPILLGQELCDQEAVRTGENSRAAIRLADDAVLRLDENTTLVLSDVAPEREKSSFLELVIGAIQSFSRDPQTLEIDTPYVNATVEGTEFALRVVPGESTLTVIEGQVLAANEFGSTRVAGGGAAVAAEGKAPQSVTIVRPRDAVAWGLYYPPALSQSEAATAPALAEAARLLSVGQVEESSGLLDSVLAAEPDNGIALAQAAVVDIVRNESVAGLEKAERALAAAPDKAAPYIALSYAQQSVFRLEEARDTLLAGSEAVPDSALIAVRLSEIWLALGYRDRSGVAAEQALALDPQLGRAHVMKGFAALTEFRTAAARESFEQAIELDSADPLPRLGLGLAKIRDGELAAGRGEIDAAVALDSNRSLLRSYLGKAYFEEDRNVLAEEQLKIAKDLDPSDPTPYLYDAIRLQSENRPGEALEAIQNSIERNDNRAVYRSKLQLDEDRAARQSSLARIYNDLGFIEPAQNEAIKSLTLDHSNASAHRFLADSYRGVRRTEAARVSEEFQAQMLQDNNINPVSPSFSETNLNIITSGGPAQAGLNEFTPLFERNQTQFAATGQIGNNDTYGGEGVISAIHDWLSVSVGIFDYETDGWRNNYDINHSIFNAYAQAAVSPELNLQFEARRRRTEIGDLDFVFDPDVFAPNQELETEADVLRAGLRYSPSPSSDLLLSGFYTDREADLFNLRNIFVEGFGTVGTSIDLAQTADEGLQFDAQYIYRQGGFNIVAGAAHAAFDRDQIFNQVLDFIPEPPFDPLPPGAVELPITLDGTIGHTKAYIYGNIEFPETVKWTVGLSYDDYRQKVDEGFAEALLFGAPVEQIALQGDTLKVDTFNPKVGVQWNVTEELLLRGAYFEYVKPQLASSRTLEPTQVAGFNQLFDDSNGVESKRWGMGLDWQPMTNVFVGAEATWREFDGNIFNFDLANARVFFSSTEFDEETHRLYVRWLPHPRWALNAEAVYDSFEAEPSVLTSGALPEDLETISFPLGVNYFHTSGFFAGLRGTYVHQEVERPVSNPLLDGKDDFFLADLALGYRLPNRKGMVSFEVQNIFDEDFNFQDDSFREFGDSPSSGPYFPDRQIMFRLTLIW